MDDKESKPDTETIEPTPGPESQRIDAGNKAWLVPADPQMLKYRIEQNKSKVRKLRERIKRDKKLLRDRKTRK